MSSDVYYYNSKKKIIHMSKIFAILALLIGLTNQLSAIEWEKYKTSHIQFDGRIIDRHDGNITHSEGIGYAMFFAVCMNDLKTYMLLEKWLENNIPKNNAGLYPWKWGNDGFGNWKVLDSNNATDGDLWIAFARLKASQKFNLLDQQIKALEDIKAIEKSLLIQRDGKLFLLPGETGFIHNNTITINPSYYIPFIFNAFFKSGGNQKWQKLIDHGLELLSSRFSHYQIHPDWIAYDSSAYTLLPEKPMFSYDALRIPLFWSIWYAIEPNQEILNRMVGYKSLLKLPYSPIYVNLLNNTMSLIPDNSGAMYRSFYFLSIISKLPIAEELKGNNEDSITYYGDSITMFSTIPIECYRY